MAIIIEIIGGLIAIGLFLICLGPLAPVLWAIILILNAPNQYNRGSYRRPGGRRYRKYGR